MTKPRLRILLLSLLLAASTAADPPAVPVGTEFQVNTYTTDSQDRPAVAADPDGNFVVVWIGEGSNGSDSSYSSVQGQRFDSAGTPLGTEFQVNTYTTFRQSFPAVAADAGGNFVVVWHSYGFSGSDSTYSCAQAQRFASPGTSLGTEFQVNTFTTHHQFYPAVAADAGGNFVVVWRSYGSSGSDSSGASIQGQRFDSAGTPLGTEFQINTYTTWRQLTPAVAADAGGNFVVVWSSDGSSGSDSSDFSIQGQRFDSAGTPLGTEFQVNTYTTDHQEWPVVALIAGGNVVVVWGSFGSSGSDSSGSSIQGQRFDSAGTPIGGEFQVNTYTTFSQFIAAVAADAGGNFVVVWSSDGSSGSDSSDFSVQGQRFDSAGTPLGTEFQVNTYTTSLQWLPAVAADAGGNFVVVWDSDGSSGSDTSRHSIQGQRYAIPIFADGFESGDVSAWSAAVPQA